MITGFGLLIASCVGCFNLDETPQTLRVSASPDVRSSVGTLNTVVPQPGQLSFEADANLSMGFARALTDDSTPSRRFGTTFSANNFAGPEAAARFNALDLSTPQGVRRQRGDSWGGELSFDASAEVTGLGVDVQVAPRARIQRDVAGGNTARTGAELRVGQGLADRDLRGKQASLPDWYLFVGADDEALVWNFADSLAMPGASLRDQATVGDLQAGVAWKTFGGQASFGLVQRTLKFGDQTGDRDVREKEHFAAFSFTYHP